MRYGIIWVILLGPAMVNASVADVFDLGPAMGKVGAISAEVDSGSAGYYNPAGLGFRAEPQLRIGGQFAYSGLHIRHQRIAFSDPAGLLVEIATPIPFRKWLADRLAIGAALYLIPKTWLAVDAPAQTEPILPYYSNRTERLVALPAIAFKPLPQVSIGVGANYFAGVTGYVHAADGAHGDLQARIEEEFFGEATLHAGAQWRWERFSAGFTYRSEFSVPVKTTSSAVLLDSPIALDIAADVLFCPETFVLGGRYATTRFAVNLDLSWRRWSQYQPPFSRVDALVPVPLSTTGETFRVESLASSIETRDTGRLAVAGELHPTEPWRVFLGYAIEPSAFPSQSGPANLIDGTKHIFGLGASWRGPPLGSLHWGVDTAIQAHWMVFQRLNKNPAQLPDDDPLLPGRQTTNLGYPTIAGGGWILAGTVSIIAELSGTEAPE